MSSEEPLSPGTRVALQRPIYGYDSGQTGTIRRTSNTDVFGEGELLVRFDATGHAVFVAAEHLRPL